MEQATLDLLSTDENENIARDICHDVGITTDMCLCHIIKYKCSYCEFGKWLVPKIVRALSKKEIHTKKRLLENSSCNNPTPCV